MLIPIVVWITWQEWNAEVWEEILDTTHAWVSQKEGPHL